MKKKICVFTLYNELGASSNYRILQFIGDLRDRYEIEAFSFWNNTYTKKYIYNKKKYFIQIILQYIISFFKRCYQLLFIASKCNIVIIQKGFIPKSSVTFFSYLKRKGIKIIFDVDDSVFLTKFDNSSEIASQSNVVLCGNVNLLKYYNNFCKKCILIPTVDNTRKYEQYHKNTFDDKIIGWIGSSATIDNLDLIVDPINSLIKKYPNVKFRFISDKPKNYISKIYNSEFIAWNKDTYMAEMSNFTVGIMPLFVNEYNKGKCGFKLIQYLSADKPVVATDLGVNKEIVGNCGYIVTNNEEWVTALEKLLFNKNIYFNFLKNISTTFYQKYHYDVVLGKLISIIEDL